MDKASGKLTVYFEEPFWVGVFERIEDGKLSVAKVTFGAEPKDYEVQEYIQKYYFSLKFSPAVDTVVKDILENNINSDCSNGRKERAIIFLSPNCTIPHRKKCWSSHTAATGATGPKTRFLLSNP